MNDPVRQLAKDYYDPEKDNADKDIVLQLQDPFLYAILKEDIPFLVEKHKYVLKYNAEYMGDYLYVAALCFHAKSFLTLAKLWNIKEGGVGYDLGIWCEYMIVILVCHGRIDDRIRSFDDLDNRKEMINVISQFLD
jgi:hypothetical protein